VLSEDISNVLILRISSLSTKVVSDHTESCIQAWSPYLQKDIYCLESVQRAATRLVRGFREVPYEDRLRILGLTTLAVRIKETRRSY